MQNRENLYLHQCLGEQDHRLRLTINWLIGARRKKKKKGGRKERQKGKKETKEGLKTRKGKSRGSIR